MESVCWTVSLLSFFDLSKDSQRKITPDRKRQWSKDITMKSKTKQVRQSDARTYTSGLLRSAHSAHVTLC